MIQYEAQESTSEEESPTHLFPLCVRRVGRAARSETNWAVG